MVMVQKRMFGESPVLVSEDGEHAGKKKRVVLREILTTRVSVSVAKKIRRAAREKNLTVSQFIAKVLAE